MSKESGTKYFTITDVINNAISKNFNLNQKKKESTELSLTIINDMTYTNIWNAFCKWCIDQTELGFLLNVFPFGNMFYIGEKNIEGISLKLSEIFLKENDLKWDESKFCFEKLPETKFNSALASIQKLNLLLISSELNLPKIYVQNGLNNIFKSIGFLLSTNFSSVLDLGILGNLHCLSKLIHHTPTKQKKEIIFNKKASVKALLLKNFDENRIPKKTLNYGKSVNFNSTINNNFNKSSNLIHSNFQANKETLSKNINFAMTAKVFPNLGSSQREIFNNLNNSNLNSSVSHADQTQRELKHGDSVVLEKLKNNIKLMNTTGFRNEMVYKNSFDNGDSFHNNLPNIPKINNNFNRTTANNFYNQANKTKYSISAVASNTNYNNNFNQATSNNFYNSQSNFQNTMYNNNNNNFNNTSMSKQVNVPFCEAEWNFKEMMNSTFRKKDRLKTSNHPVLFNAYSNTKAAPFTSEKTQIPITHRIGSFYSLPLQNFIIDKTSKCVKRLYDEYFLKYKKIRMELPATEDEEYLSLLGLYQNEEKVELRKNAYERYQDYILKFIPDEVLCDIKEAWLVNIIKMSMRPYNLSEPEKYNTMLSEYIKDILHMFRVSMKQSIIDYILKHPEQREKLGIAISFKKTKEYAEDRINRPSDENWEWKKNWNFAKIRISNNLMVMGENITKIQKYFVKNLSATSYLDLPPNYITYSLNSFIDNQKAKIEDQKKIVNEDWKQFVENALKENKLYKDQMIIYFKSISAVMSSQLRKLIIKSIQDFSDFISSFKKEEYFNAKRIFEDQFKPDFPFQQSFLEISIKSASDKMSFIFSDELSDIHSRLLGIIHELVRCSQDVERPDNMFIKNLEKRNSLWEVPVNDINISEIMGNIDSIIKENLDSINKVIEIYDPFVFVLNEEMELEKFKGAGPRREEIKKRIAFYEEKLKILREQMPNSLYMNLIKIDCAEINLNLRDSLVNYIYDLLRYIQSKNISGKSKEINDEIEHLIAELKTTPKDEEELYLLEYKLETYKSETVPNITSNYQDFLEWVFFYLDYDKYQILPENSKLNDTMGSIETIVRTSHHTVKLISPAMETFESVLKEKRATFEKSLLEFSKEYNQKVDQLRSRIDDKKKKAPVSTHDETFVAYLKEDEKEIEELFAMLQVLVKREELLGAYPTESEKLENCKKDLEPLIHYFIFLAESKEVALNDLCEIRNMDFAKLGLFVERASDVFENHVSKLSNMKGSVNKKRVEFETIKVSAEAGKSVFSLVEILNYDKILEENKSLVEENKIYCTEYTKLVFQNELGQAYLKTIKFNVFIRNPQNLEKFKENKQEIDKLIEEWENIKSIYDLISKTLQNCDIGFELENFKDKKYIVISHESYAFIKNVLNESIKTLDESLEKNDSFKFSNKTLIKLQNFKGNVCDLNELLKQIEACQIRLENNMLKANVLQKNQDMFMKLKQAEQFYKNIIDFLQENPKCMYLLKVKDSIKDIVNSLTGVLEDLPYGAGENHK